MQSIKIINTNILVSQESFKTFQNFHTPLKQKKVRGNHGPFMIKDLSNTIMNKSKTRNRYLKWPSRENFLAMKSSKNLCNNLVKTNKRSYFQKVPQKGFANNKAFWNTIKPSLTNKGSYLLIVSR